MARIDKTIIILLLIILFVLMVMISSGHCSYVRYDKEDKVWRDWGTITNYMEVLEEEKMELINSRSVITNIVRSNIIKIEQVAEDCEPSFLERWGFPVGIVTGVILILLF